MELLHADRVADRSLPLLRAAGIALVADLGPGRQRNVAPRALYELDVRLGHRYVDELELLPGRARVATDVAVDRVDEKLLGILPHVLGLRAARRLELGLLVGLELAPRLQRDRIGIERHLEGDRQLMRRHLGPAG